MDVADLRFFIAVYESEGFSRASEKLGTVQSNVSARIRSLEGSLGVPLFERRYRRGAPTAPGDQPFPPSRKGGSAPAAAVPAGGKTRPRGRGTAGLARRHRRERGHYQSLNEIRAESHWSGRPGRGARPGGVRPRGRGAAGRKPRLHGALGARPRGAARRLSAQRELPGGAVLAGAAGAAGGRSAARRLDRDARAARAP